MSIIGLVGLIGSGKDTAADFLVNFHGFRRESFASTLKDAVAAVFGWDRQMLEGRTEQSRQWREQVDPWWAERLKMPHLTPRWVLQFWGTDVCRVGFNDEIWVASLENKLRKSMDNIVISDCRFVNEVNAIRNAGGKVVRIVRSAEPEWYQSAVDYNRGPNNNPNWALSKAHLDRLNVHASEYSWVGTEFDLVLDNTGSIDFLYKQIKNLVQGQLLPTEADSYELLADS